MGFAVFGEYLRIKILLCHPIKHFNVQIFKLNVGIAFKTRILHFFCKNSSRFN